MFGDKPEVDRREFLCGTGAVAVMGATSVRTGFFGQENTATPRASELKKAPILDVFTNSTLNKTSDEATIRFFVSAESNMYPFTIYPVVHPYPEKNEILFTHTTKEVQGLSSLESPNNETVIEQTEHTELIGSYFPSLEDGMTGNILFNLSIDIGNERFEGGGPFVVSFYLQPSSSSELYYLSETDSFTFQKNGEFEAPVKNYPASDTETDKFKRTENPGVYNLQFALNPFKPFEIQVAKSDYERCRSKKERWTPSMYKEQKSNKYARYIGTLAERRAKKYMRNTQQDSPYQNAPQFEKLQPDFEQRRFKFARKFAQTLPYKKDFKNSGKYHYPQYIEETLVQGCGDCEDFALLLASIFEQPPFNYKTALIFLPTHIGVGLRVEDVPFDNFPSEGIMEINNEDFAFLDSTANSRLGKTNEWDLDNFIYTYTNSGWDNVKPLNMIDASVENLKRVVSHFL